MCGGGVQEAIELENLLLLNYFVCFTLKIKRNVEV